jgi:hypothetical protein
MMKRWFGKAVAFVGNVTVTTIATVAATFTAVLTAAKSYALGDITDLFDAAALTDVSTGVKTLLISMIAIALMFVAYKLVRRSLARP